MDITASLPVLVSGASGFIGGRLVRRLIDRRCQVSCLVRANSWMEDLRSIGAQLIMGDVTDRSGVERALAESKAAAVFHLAGLVKARSRDEFNSVNAVGVETVAAACADRAGPPVLIVVSSLAAAGPCDAHQLRVESDVPAPVSSYGRSKLAGEQAAAKYADTVPISIVRPPIVFGPGDRGVLEIFRPIARWGLHVVPGRSERRFSLIHVDDLVEGLILAADKGERMRGNGSAGEGFYFMAGEENPTYAQLGQAIAMALGQKPPRVIHMPGPLVRLVGMGGDAVAKIRRRAGWVSSDKTTEALAGSWACSSAKACAQLGWSTTAALAIRLQETAQWYRTAEWL